MTLVIVSGGSPGAERGALQAAIDLGIAIAGWRCAGEPALPIFATALRVTSSSDRGMARRLCIQDSDGALALSSAIAPVGVVAFADRATEQQGKPFLSVVLGQQMPEAVRGSVLDWLRDNDVQRLYVTGPAEDDEPGVEAAVRKTVRWLFEGAAVEDLGGLIDVMRLMEGAVDSDQPSAPAPTIEEVVARVARVSGKPSHIAIPIENVDLALERALTTILERNIEQLVERAPMPAIPPRPGEFDDCDCPSHCDQDGNITRRPQGDPTP